MNRINTNRISLSLLLLAFSFGPLSTSSAAALDLVPFSTTNRNPLVAVYGLPPVGPAETLAPGRTSAELRAKVASSFSRDSRAGESILLDGETYRFALALRHGIADRFEIGLEIPFVMHREGFLDGFIVDWHDFFQLPQGGRDAAPRDRLTYAYVKEGRAVVDLRDESEGMGDLRLTGAWQLWGETGEPRALALRASLKIPTGDADRLLGSGSTDLALWLSGSEAFRGGSLALFGGAGAVLMSDGDVLPGQQRYAVGFGTFGGGWKPLPRLALKAQLDGHTPFYNSDLRELSGSVQLAVGGTIAWTDTLALDLAVIEDIIVDSAPDVVFHLALRQVF